MARFLVAVDGRVDDLTTAIDRVRAGLAPSSPPGTMPPVPRPVAVSSPAADLLPVEIGDELIGEARAAITALGFELATESARGAGPP